MIAADVHLGGPHVLGVGAKELRLVGHALVPGDGRLAAGHVDEAQDVNVGAEAGLGLAHD